MANVNLYLVTKFSFSACLHEGGGPYAGEVTQLGGVIPHVHIMSHINLITFT